MSTVGLFVFLSVFQRGAGGRLPPHHHSPLLIAVDYYPPRPQGPELSSAADSQHVMQLGFVLEVWPTFCFITLLNPQFIVIFIIVIGFLFFPLERFPLLRCQVGSLFCFAC